MDLKEGMYVRYDGKIGKYTQPDLGKAYITNSISFFEGANYGKYSYDIIDLIEVGDYVNGSKVANINYDLNYDEDIIESITIFDYSIEGFDILHNEDIKSIVTKECFKSISYKVD